VGLEYSHKLEQFPPEGSLDLVKFRLVYDGALPPEDRATPGLKQQIREQLHPQLRNLWYEHPMMRSYVREKHGQNHKEVDRVADAYAAHGFRWVPLIRLANHMACSLNILVLLRREPYQVFSGTERGDLDNRIKTLIDGLRMPRQKTEVGNIQPPVGNEPFFCLLEDDKAVYEFNVRADRLLAPPRPDQKERDVVAVISVHVTTSEGFELSGWLQAGFGLEGE